MNICETSLYRQPTLFLQFEFSLYADYNSESIKVIGINVW